MTSSELANNKGPKAATQLLFALNQMAEASPEFKDLVLKMNIEVQFITKNDAKRTNFVLNSEEKLKTVTSKALSLDYSHTTMLPSFIEEAGRTLETNKDITKEALEKELRILTQDELKKIAKEVIQLKLDLQDTSKTSTNAQIIENEIYEKERQIARTFLYRNALAYGDALPTLINEIDRLNEIYKNLNAINETREIQVQKRSILDLVKTLDEAIKTTKQNAEKFSLVVAEGGVVRAKTLVERVMEIVKRK